MRMTSREYRNTADGSWGDVQRDEMLSERERNWMEREGREERPIDLSPFGQDPRSTSTSLAGWLAARLCFALCSDAWLITPLSGGRMNGWMTRRVLDAARCCVGLGWAGLVRNETK